MTTEIFIDNSKLTREVHDIEIYALYARYEETYTYHFFTDYHEAWQRAALIMEAADIDNQTIDITLGSIEVPTWVDMNKISEFLAWQKNINWKLDTMTFVTVRH
jgi:hypothetical protein